MAACFREELFAFRNDSYQSDIVLMGALIPGADCCGALPVQTSAFHPKTASVDTSFGKDTNSENKQE